MGENNADLPNMRFGVGLLTRLEGEDKFVLPVRDNGPIAMPKRIDGQMGVKEQDESIEEAQSREGSEETAFVKETEDETLLGVPTTIQGTELEDNLFETYQRASLDEDSPLPDFDGVFYFEASQEVPDGMSTVEAEDEGYETGYTWEIDEDVSMELMNDHMVGIGYEEIVEGEIDIYDIEYMETDEGAIHFNRPTVLLEPTEDQVTVFRSGEKEYEGDVEGFRDHLSNEYGWDMEEVGTPATAKVQARMHAYKDDASEGNLGDQSSEQLINDEYMNRLIQLGEAFEGFPSP